MNKKNPKNSQQPLLPFLIHHVSSEDPEYPATELLSGSSSSKGWQTQRFASFPQHLTIKFARKTQLHSFQYLSHQCKIASKVELYIALNGQNTNEPVFKKLGYFTLSNNENSKYQSRELKTVYIEAPVQFVKFVFQHPYANNLNFFNQVGVIALSFFGSEIGGNSTEVQQVVSRKAQPSDDLQMGAQFDQRTLDLIDQLEKEKQMAVEDEDYARAKLLKEQIQKVKESMDIVARLEQQKKVLVENEDYEGAEVIKREIANLVGGKSGNNNKQTDKEKYGEQNRTRAPSAYRQEESSPEHGQYEQRERENESLEKQGNVKRVQNGTVQSNQRQTNINEKTSEGIRPKTVQVISKDFDDQPIPTSIKDKNSKPMMDEYPPDNQESKSTNEVSKKHTHAVSLLSIYFDVNFLKDIFSVAIQSRLGATERFLQEVDFLSQNQGQVSSEVFVTHDFTDAILGSWKLAGLLLEERATQIFQNTCRVFDILLEISANKKISGFLKHADGFGILLDSLMEIIQDKLGDFKNGDTMDWCTNTVLSLHGNGLMSSEDIIDKMVNKPTGKAKPVMSAKQITGKLILLQNYVKEFGMEIKQGQQKLVRFCVELLENKDKSVRDESNLLIVEIFKVIGEEKMLKMLEIAKIKKPQLENLRQKFEEAFADEQSQDEVPANPVNNRKQKKVDSVEDTPEDDQDDLDQSNAKSVENSNECHFCGSNDSNFSNTDFMDLHLYKHCLMLMTCEECQQVIEVKELNHHLLNECKNCNSFSQCSRCLKAISNDVYKNHTSKMNCKMQRPDQKSPRCPLCLNDLIVKKNDPDQTLKDHLVNRMCPSHPRDVQ